jgi:hypothetical protein
MIQRVAASMTVANGRTAMSYMTRFWTIGLVLAGCADTPTQCDLSVTEFCASSSLPCPMTLSEAQDPMSWGGCGARTSNNEPLVLKNCGDVMVVELWGIDASTNYYYDAATGELVSMASHRAIREQDVCVAGAAQTEVCNDPAPRDLCP